MPRLLIADDDTRFLDLMGKLLAGRGYEVELTPNGAAALESLRTKGADLLVSDIHMDALSGLEVLKAARALAPQLPVVMITAQGTVDTALECLRMGAFDYLTKPFRVADFLDVIERALAWKPGAQADNAQPQIPYRLGYMVAESRSMQDVCTMIERIAPTDATVLFRGEMGVGKKHAGQVMHLQSRRREGPFIIADCRQVPREQLTDTLFGSGGDGKTPFSAGLIRQADGGTLWLSEIGSLSTAVQERLLILFRDQAITEGGHSAPRAVNVRVMAETSMDVEAAVRRGLFRADLFARFAPLAIEIKPLRERREDVVPLIWHFCHDILGQDSPLPTIDPDARGLLTHYGWPGNIAELEAVMQTILANGPRPRIGIDVLPEPIVRLNVTNPSSLANVESDRGRASHLKAFLKANQN